MINARMNLELKQTRKIYEKTGAGIGPVDLSIEAGSFVSILGPSGCGKSTLLRLIANIEKPDQGEIRQEQKMSFGFQEAALLPWKPVIENIILPLKLKGIDAKAAKEKAMPWIDQLGLTPFIGSYPHELSGGLKMRVSLARAFITEPKLLLLDEPFSALDEPIRMELGLLLRQIWKEYKPTILLVTHSITEAVWLAERILIIRGKPGKIIYDQKNNLPGDDLGNRPLSIRGKPEFHAQVEHCFDLLKVGTS